MDFLSCSFWGFFSTVWFFLSYLLYDKLNIGFLLSCFLSLFILMALILILFKTLDELNDRSIRKRTVIPGIDDVEYITVCYRFHTSPFMPNEDFYERIDKHDWIFYNPMDVRKEMGLSADCYVYVILSDNLQYQSHIDDIYKITLNKSDGDILSDPPDCWIWTKKRTIDINTTFLYIFVQSRKCKFNLDLHNMSF